MTTFRKGTDLGHRVPKLGPPSSLPPKYFHSFQCANVSNTLNAFCMSVTQRILSPTHLRISTVANQSSVKTPSSAITVINSPNTETSFDGAPGWCFNYFILRLAIQLSNQT